jgi:DNA-binding XRE family transcriptional regulator
MIERCYKRFGKNLRNVRPACGVRQDTLAKRVSLQRTFLANIDPNDPFIRR